MSLGEFSLIEKYFASHASKISNENLLLGIGDDAAIIKTPAGQCLVQTIDTLVSGRHFPEQSQADDIGYKSLAVNVSDLVAMAATPSHFLLSLTLPENDETFIQEFSSGLFEAADEFSIQLVGGDTCKGPLSITIQANGLVPCDGYISRSKAESGDSIFVTGELGNAALGLADIQGRVRLETTELETTELGTSEASVFRQALNRPKPRLEYIDLLRNHASSAIDLSDGLAGDLAHVLKQSGVGATIEKPSIPVPDWIMQHDAYEYALHGGDDYQILFTVSESQVKPMLEQAALQQLDVFKIGVITQQGFYMNDQQLKIDLSQQGGFDHFGA